MDKYNEYDKYCYPDTNVLINKLNIENAQTLEKAERDITSKTIYNIKYEIPPYSFKTLEKIHNILFCDIYEWAGNMRDVSISKGDTLFCMPQHILSNINKIFKDLENDDWLKKLDEDTFYDKMSYYYCEFNMIHPFREGNGRVQRMLFLYLASYNGYSFDLSEIEEGAWLEINIEGVTDYSSMKILFKKILSKIKE